MYCFKIRKILIPFYFFLSLCLLRTGSNPDTTAVGVTPSALPAPSPPTSVQTSADIPSEAPRRAKQPAPLVRER